MIAIHDRPRPVGCALRATILRRPGLSCSTSGIFS